jgi:ribose/xylose/arabinose/galactoside ABC-type transport system permease subunit
MIRLLGRRNDISRRVTAQRFFKDYGLIVIMLIVIAAITSMERNFLSLENIIGILYQVAIIGVMAACMTFVIIVGGIDLSVGPIMAISGLLAVFTLESTGMSVLPAILLGLLAGASVGSVNGFAIGRFKLPPFVVTLGMMSMIRGTALLIGDATPHQISGPESFLFIGSGRVFGIPLSVFIFAVVAVLLYFIQTRTPFGLTVFAIGENQEAARLAGLPVLRTKTLVYTLSGVGASIAGIILASRVHTASAVYGNGAELDAIAAVVLGGTSLAGGSGSVHRSVLGSLLIGIVNNGLSILNVSIELQLVAKGIIIILALALDRYLQFEK